MIEAGLRRINKMPPAIQPWGTAMQLSSTARNIVFPCLLIGAHHAEAVTITVNGDVTGTDGTSFPYSIGNGGDAADLTVINNTSTLFNPANVNPGDTVNLSQRAQAGSGGSADVQGSGGNGGNALSIQNWTEPNAANTFISTTAVGGGGGLSYDQRGGGSGTGTADSSMVVGGNATLNVTGVGGRGGFNTNGRTSQGQNGSDGYASASGITGNNGSMSVNVIATGGQGATSYDSGFGGVAAQGNITKAYGQSDTGTVTVSATQYGGTGGSGYHGAAGANGADSNMNNVVSGSTAGNLNLYQTAKAGNGGAAITQGLFVTPIIGNGGNARSGLNLTDASSNNLLAIVNATGGTGGATDAYTSGSNGGNAVADATLKSTLLNNNYSSSPTVQATANATAGTGGASPNWPVSTGPAGIATANASASAAGVYGQSVAIANVQGAAVNTASATSESASAVANPALITTAQAVTQSAGNFQSQATAVYVNGSGFNIGYASQQAATALALVSGLPADYAQGQLPVNGHLDLSQFEAMATYQNTQTGIATVTDTITIKADLSQLAITGNVFLSGTGTATGAVQNLTQTETVTISGTIETWTLKFTAQLLDPGASFDYRFIAYDPLANPSLQNFNQSFASANELNSFYAQNQIFDLGAPAAVPLPATAWMFLTGLLVLPGIKLRKKCLPQNVANGSK